MLRLPGVLRLVQSGRAISRCPVPVSMSTQPSSRSVAAAPQEMDRMLPYRFDLPQPVTYVDSQAGLQSLRQALSKACLIGIDTETKPCFVPKRLQPIPNPTSTLQIATRSGDWQEHAFLVDLLTISRSIALMQDLDECLATPFQNAECIKLGQGLTCDLKELVASYPRLKAFQITKGVLEMQDLSKRLDSTLTNAISLKNLVRKHLHLDLEKRQQMSDWGRRPLTPFQIQYAACDALVLLRLYDAMGGELEAQLSAADAEISDNSGSNSGTTSSDYSAMARSSLASLCRTVDWSKYAAQILTKPTPTSRPQGLNLEHGLLQQRGFWHADSHRVVVPDKHQVHSVKLGRSSSPDRGSTAEGRSSNKAAIHHPRLESSKQGPTSGAYTSNRQSDNNSGVSSSSTSVSGSPRGSAGKRKRVDGDVSPHAAIKRPGQVSAELKSVFEDLHRQAQRKTRMEVITLRPASPSVLNAPMAGDVERVKRGKSPVLGRHVVSTSSLSDSSLSGGSGRA
jgi:hypothetical protein